jgi:Haem-binding domain
MRRKIIITILIILVLIQFIRPKRNVSASGSPQDIAIVYPTPDSVKQLLKRSCYDCHSNNTVYPWYTNLQPVGWWLQMHVNDGKHHVDYSSFASYEPRRQAKALHETVETIKEDEMPLDSYVWIHKNAILTENDKLLISEWATKLEKEIRQKYNLPEDLRQR